MELITHIRQELKEMADESYRQFQSTLLPGTDNILGVRIPQLRKMAKKIARHEEWRSFVTCTESLSYEETMLRGIVIGVARSSFDEQKKYVEQFVPHIDNWAVCDIFCGELKTFVNKNRTAVWEFIAPYFDSPHEFEVRFATVMLFHYIDETHLHDIFNHADRFAHNGYYARMGMAWLLSICFVKYPDAVQTYLPHSKLDTWTYNKALQKIIESNRVDKTTKQLVKTMKR